MSSLRGLVKRGLKFAMKIGDKQKFLTYNLLYPIILSIVVIVIFRGILLESGIPRGHDIGTYVLAKYDAEHNSWRYIWDDSRYPEMIKNPTRLSLPYLVVVFALKLGLNLQTTLRFIYIFIVFLALYSAYFFTKEVSGSNIGASISSLFYIINPIAPFYAGFNFSMGYAITPLLFLYVYKLLNKYDSWNFQDLVKVSLILFITITSTILPHLVVVVVNLLLYILLTYFLSYGLNRKVFVKLAQGFLIVFLISITLSSYYLSNVFINYLTGGFEKPYSLETYRNVNFIDAFSLIPPVGFVFYEKLSPTFLLFGVPIIAFLSLLVRSSNKNVIIFSFLSLLTIFFAVGPGEFLRLLYDNLPLLKYIRMANRQLIVTAFYYSVLISIFMSLIIKKVEVILSSYRLNFIKTFMVLVIIIFLTFFFFYFHTINYAREDWIGTYTISDRYKDTFSWFSNDQKDFGILATPALVDKIYTNQSLWAINFGRTFGPAISKHPVLGGFRKGIIEVNPEVRKLMDETLTPRWKNTTISPFGINPQFTKILALLNIKYIAILPHTSEIEEKVLRSQRHIAPTFNNSNIVRNQIEYPKIYTPYYLAVTRGNPNTLLKNLVKIETFNFNETALVDYEETHDLNKLNPDFFIISDEFWNSSEEIGTYSDYLLKYVYISDASNWRIKRNSDFISLQKQINIRESNSYRIALLTSINKLNSTYMELNDEYKGNLSITPAYTYFNAFLNRQIETYWLFSEPMYIREGLNNLSISLGKINLEKQQYPLSMIDTIVIYDSNYSTPEDIFVIPEKEERNNMVVSYTKINPTLYKVKISEDISEREILIVFQESYNKNWKLSSNDNKLEYSPIKVNYFSIGYLITDGGNYSIEFHPQDLFNKFLFLSSLSTLILILYITRMLI